MAKNTIRISIAILGVLVLAAVFLFGSLSSATWTYYISDKLRMPFVCDYVWIDLGNDIRQCREAFALKYKDVTACDKHDYCYKRYFEQYPTNDATVCDKISNTVFVPELNLSRRGICKTNQNTVVHNLEICQSMSPSSSRDGCFTGQAIYLGDASICKAYITDASALASCYVGVAGKIKDPSLCEHQPDAWLKDQCMQFATAP